MPVALRSLVAVSCVLAVVADTLISSSIRNRLKLKSGDVSVINKRILPLRLSNPVLRLFGGAAADVTKRTVLDEYSHEVKSRHEGKSGVLSVEVQASRSLALPNRRSGIDRNFVPGC